MDYIKPNPISRALVDSTMDRTLKDVDQDPARSIRKMTDLGRMIAKGRFMSEIYSIVQDLLRNDDSLYYQYIRTVLKQTSTKNLKDFCISFGYSGLTFGARRIRELEQTADYRIPWCMGLRVDPPKKGTLTVSEIRSCIEQGMPLGIYIYFVRISGSNACLRNLLSLFSKYPDCAFLVFLPDQALSQDQIERMKNCTNTGFLLPVGADTCRGNLAALISSKILCALYAQYDNQTATDWYNGKKTKSLLSYNKGTIMLVSSDDCTRENGEKVAAYCKNLRTHPKYPLILFDLVGDTMATNHIVSEDSTYFELLENGDIRNEDGIRSDFRHTISLETLFSIGLPKKETPEKEN